MSNATKVAASNRASSANGISAIPLQSEKSAEPYGRPHMGVLTLIPMIESVDGSHAFAKQIGQAGGELAAGDGVGKVLQT